MTPRTIVLEDNSYLLSRRLTFEHDDFDGGAIRSDAVVPHAQVGAPVRNLDVLDEQGADIGAIRAGLGETRPESDKDVLLRWQQLLLSTHHLTLSLLRTNHRLPVSDALKQHKCDV